MSKIVIVTWPGGGNQPPAIGLAQRLRVRGHDVVFAGYPQQVDRFAALGFALVVMPGASRRWETFEPGGLSGFLLDRVWACPEHLTDVAAVVERESPDLIVVDCMLGAALAAVEDAGVPTAAQVHSAPGILCPPGAGAPELAALNAVRARSGLDRLDTFRAAWERHPVLCATIPELDPRAAAAPAGFRWVGPVFEDTPAGAYAPEPDDRPLVLVSFSSGPAWDQTSRIQRTLDGLARSGVRVLATTGAVDPTTLDVPENATALPYAPHGAVLPHAAAVVTHAGHGTLTAALAHGLPVVALPNLGADQAALATQVAQLGAGLHLDGDTARADDVRRAVEQVLSEPSYRTTAQRLARRITEHQGGLDEYLGQLLARSR